MAINRKEYRCKASQEKQKDQHSTSIPSLTLHMSVSLVISLVSPLCLPAFPFVAVDVLITPLCWQRPRYFDVLITPCRTSMSISTFFSHTGLSLDLKAFSHCHLHPQPKHSETSLSKPPEIDTGGQWESLLALTSWPPGWFVSRNILLFFWGVINYSVRTNQQICSKINRISQLVVTTYQNLEIFVSPH